MRNSARGAPQPCQATPKPRTPDTPRAVCTQTSARRKNTPPPPPNKALPHYWVGLLNELALPIGTTQVKVVEAIARYLRNYRFYSRDLRMRGKLEKARDHFASTYGCPPEWLDEWTLLLTDAYYPAATDALSLERWLGIVGYPQ